MLGTRPTRWSAWAVAPRCEPIGRPAIRHATLRSDDRLIHGFVLPFLRSRAICCRQVCVTHAAAASGDAVCWGGFHAAWMAARSRPISARSSATCPHNCHAIAASDSASPPAWASVSFRGRGEHRLRCQHRALISSWGEVRWRCLVKWSGVLRWVTILRRGWLGGVRRSLRLAGRRVRRSRARHHVYRSRLERNSRVR